MYGHVSYGYTLAVVFVLFLAARRMVNSPFGWSVARGEGQNALRTAALGIPVTFRLVGIYTLAAGYAGIAGALLAETTQFVSLDVLTLQRSRRCAVDAGDRRRRLSLWRPDRRVTVQADAGLAGEPDAAILAVLDWFFTGSAGAGQTQRVVFFFFSLYRRHYCDK